MRGRASGFGARISSMGLLIVHFHWTNQLLDVSDFLIGDSIFLVELFVCPWLREVLKRNELIGRARQVLRGRPYGNQKPEQSRDNVRKTVPRFFFSVVCTKKNVCLRHHGTWRNAARQRQHFSLSVLVCLSCVLSRRLGSENFPLVDQIFASRDFRARCPCAASTLKNENIILRRFLFYSPEECAKAKWFL